jgi:septum formation protein
MPDFIYLASQSPRRRELLRQIGVAHELLLPGPGEDAEALEALHAGESARAYVQRVTLAKLDAALRRLPAGQRPGVPVLAADTTVTVQGRILGKPADAAEARRMLGWLSGREHRVLTAVAVACGRRRDMRLSESRVRFASLSAAQIRRYVASGEPMGKAGAYAIQSQAAAWITHISGSYSGIMGLPLHETAELLRGAGMAV